MNNRQLWLAAAGSFGVAFFAASCGTPDPVQPTTCSTDAACGMGKGCHPVLKTCVATCSGASDCSSDQKTCAKIQNSAVSFCTCSTNELCAASNTGFICNSASQQCSAKCTSNASCPSGFTCDTATGNCGAGGNTDAGMDAGVDAGVMDAGVACNATNPQPDTCGYGSACTQSMSCEAIDKGTCSNVTTGTGGTNHNGWTSASTGPVIFNIVDEADVSADCTADNAFTMTVYAYAGPGMTFPAMKSALPGFFYYTSSGTAVDIPSNLLKQSNYTLYGNTVMGAKFTLCSANTSSLAIGVGFTNGNGFCTTLTR